MIRILLLDCASALEERLKNQGFNVESGTVGACTGVRKLPSQVYEKDVFVYNPTEVLNVGRVINVQSAEDRTPQYSLGPLRSRIENGATLLVFVNKLVQNAALQNAIYDWIPFMPKIDFTHDDIVVASSFERYPDFNWELLAPIAAVNEVDLPVLQKINLPKPSPNNPPDVIWIFGNRNSDCLGVLILRGQGRLIILPRCKSNDEVIDTFCNYVIPELYDIVPKAGLIDEFTSPEEQESKSALDELDVISVQIKARQKSGQSDLDKARRTKATVINADATARQVLVYYDQARRQEKAALFYLYKVIEAIENKYGGEGAGIKAIGAPIEWKSVKRLANESYRDARHAPKPTDIIKNWSKAEIAKCFEDTQKVILAYFATLFDPAHP